MKLVIAVPPASYTIVQTDQAPFPIVTEGGDTDYCCCTCGAVLLEQIPESSIQDIVFRCPVCGTNNLPPRPEELERAQRDNGLK